MGKKTGLLILAGLGRPAFVFFASMRIMSLHFAGTLEVHTLTRPYRTGILPSRGEIFPLRPRPQLFTIITSWMNTEIQSGHAWFGALLPQMDYKNFKALPSETLSA